MPGYIPLVDALLETGMTAVVSAVIAALVGVLVTSIGRAAGRSREREEQTDRMRQLTQDGVGMLIRDKLLAYYKHHVRIGYISIEDRQTFDDLWRIYHDMGLNHLCDEVHDRVTALPTYRREEKEEPR